MKNFKTLLLILTSLTGSIAFGGDLTTIPFNNLTRDQKEDLLGDVDNVVMGYYSNSCCDVVRYRACNYASVNPILMIEEQLAAGETDRQTAYEALAMMDARIVVNPKLKRRITEALADPTVFARFMGVVGTAPDVVRTALGATHAVASATETIIDGGQAAAIVAGGIRRRVGAAKDSAAAALRGEEKGD